MMIVMKQTATEDEIQAVIDRIESVGAHAHPSRGEEVTVIGAIGDREHVARLELEGSPGVDQRGPDPQAVQARLARRSATTSRRSSTSAGARSAASTSRSSPGRAPSSRATDAHHRRTSSAAPARRCSAAAPTSRARRPYAFQGLGAGGPAPARRGQAETGLPVVTEVMDARDVEPVLEVADMLQIGARNMQNYALLAEVGRAGRPVLLKRGLVGTIEELLMAAEYILKEGNQNVVLCERGIRTFETAYRYTLDITAVPVLKELTHLPVIVDPSHAAGPARRSSRRCRSPRPRPAPTASSSRCTRSPRRRSATARRRCAPTASPSTRARSSRPPRSRARCRSWKPRPPLDRRGRRRRPDRRVGRTGRPPQARRARSRGIDPHGARCAPSSRRDRRGRTATSAPRSTAPTSRSSPRPSACCPGGRRGARGGAAGLRRHRRRLDQARGGRRATATSASSAATRSPAPRPPASSTPAPTSSTAPPGTSRRRRRRPRHRCSSACTARSPASAPGPPRSTPRRHDRMMAAVSHLPHVLANVLVAQAARALGGERLPATGPSFRDATRVAGANPDLWPTSTRKPRRARATRSTHDRAPAGGARPRSPPATARRLRPGRPARAGERRRSSRRGWPAAPCTSCAPSCRTGRASSPTSP